MDDFYDALYEIKAEVNTINFTIAREQDSLNILETTLKELETQKTAQTLEITKLEMTAQSLEYEYNMQVIKNESLTRELDELNNQIEVIDKTLVQKSIQLEQLEEFHQAKVNMSIEIRERNHAKYSTIPCLKKYMDLSALCSQLSETVSKLTTESNQLKKEYGDSLGQNELGNDKTVVETIDLEQDIPVQQVSYQSMQDFGVMLQQLAEENRLLRKRLEELEMKSRREPILPEKVAPLKQLEMKTRPEPAMVQQFVPLKASQIQNRQEPFTVDKVIPLKDFGVQYPRELFTFEKNVSSKSLAKNNSQETFVFEEVNSSKEVIGETHLEGVDVDGGGSLINFNFMSTLSPIGGSLF